MTMPSMKRKAKRLKAIMGKRTHTLRRTNAKKVDTFLALALPIQTAVPMLDSSPFTSMPFEFISVICKECKVRHDFETFQFL